MKFNLLRLCAAWRFFCVAVMEEVRGHARTQFKVVGSNPVSNIGAMTWMGLCEMEKVKGGARGNRDLKTCVSSLGDVSTLVSDGDAGGGACTVSGELYEEGSGGAHQALVGQVLHLI